MHDNYSSPPPFERFRLDPWMGFVAAAVLMATAGNSDEPEWIIARGIGMTCFFTSAFVASRRRTEAGSGAPTSAWRPLIFAVFSALVTIVFLAAYILDRWTQWIGAHPR